MKLNLINYCYIILINICNCKKSQFIKLNLTRNLYNIYIGNYNIITGKRGCWICKRVKKGRNRIWEEASSDANILWLVIINCCYINYNIQLYYIYKLLIIPEQVKNAEKVKLDMIPLPEAPSFQAGCLLMFFSVLELQIFTVWKWLLNYSWSISECGFVVLPV